MLETMSQTILGDMKPCFVCKQVKELRLFSKHKGMADGHLNKCKSCAIEYSKAHREANPEYYKEFEKGRSLLPERKAATTAYIKAYEAKHPNRKEATTLLNNAVRRGVIEKQPCFECGEKAVAHHSDYNNPLGVTWLCHKHHRQLHKEYAAAG